MSLDLEEEDNLFVLHTRLEKLHSACSFKSSHTSGPTAAPVADGKGVRLQVAQCVASGERCHQNWCLGFFRSPKVAF